MLRTDRVFYVYVRFRLDGRPCYVGKGNGQRLFHTGKKGSHLYNIIKKAGGKTPVVIVRNNLTEQEAFETETAFIRAIGREDNGGPLVNKTDGGEGPSNPCDVTRHKMRLGKLGRKQSKEAIEKRRLKRIGVPLSVEHRAILSASASRLRALGIALPTPDMIQKLHDRCAGTIWINNGTERRRIKKTEQIPDGWRLGQRFKSLPLSLSIWVNNGKKRYKHPRCEPIPDGWVIGKKF